MPAIAPRFTGVDGLAPMRKPWFRNSSHRYLATMAPLFMRHSCTSGSIGYHAVHGVVIPNHKAVGVLTLGQVAHKKPELCVPAATSALRDDDRCRDAMRILAFIGPSARSALPPVIEKFSHSDATVRKAALITAIAIAPHERAVMDLVNAAASDRSKIVRAVAEKRILKDNT